MAISRLLIGILFSSSVHAFNGFGQDIDHYIKEASKRYHVSEPMLRGLIKMEDGWYGNVSPTGAIGVGQFTKGTWNRLAKTEKGRAIGMKPITSSIRGTQRDPRHHKRINTLATALLAQLNIEQFQLRGIPVTDENVYMAHNIGLDGLHRALLGKSTAEDVANMRRNGMKRGMSVEQFMAYQKARYTSHKYAANFSSPVVSQTAMQWVEPQPITRSALPVPVKPNVSPNTLIWVEPSDKDMIWLDKTASM